MRISVQVFVTSSFLCLGARFVCYVPLEYRTASVRPIFRPSTFDCFPLLPFKAILCPWLSISRCENIFNLKLSINPEYIQIELTAEHNFLFLLQSMCFSSFVLSRSVFLSVCQSGPSRFIIEYLPCSYSFLVRPIEYSMVGQISCKCDTHVFNRTNLIQTHTHTHKQNNNSAAAAANNNKKASKPLTALFTFVKRSSHSNKSNTSIGWRRR